MLCRLWFHAWTCQTRIVHTRTQWSQLSVILTVLLTLALHPAALVWAQTIQIPALSDWLNTVSWYSFVPLLRIIGASAIIAGFALLGGSRPGSNVAGLITMFAGGAMLLGPEIANAIYAKTTIGDSWATQPTGAAP